MVEMAASLASCYYSFQVDTQLLRGQGLQQRWPIRGGSATTGGAAPSHPPPFSGAGATGGRGGESLELTM
ncbi:hypothetical protein LINGRAHAP2_LOCUS20779, partial [Linum grandiflorum]